MGTFYTIGYALFQVKLIHDQYVTKLNGGLDSWNSCGNTGTPFSVLVCQRNWMGQVLKTLFPANHISYVFLIR